MRKIKMNMSNTPKCNHIFVRIQTCLYLEQSIVSENVASPFMETFFKRIYGLLIACQIVNNSRNRRVAIYNDSFKTWMAS